MKTTLLVLGDLDRATLAPGAATSSQHRKALDYQGRGTSIEIIDEKPS